MCRAEALGLFLPCDLMESHPSSNCFALFSVWDAVSGVVVTFVASVAQSGYDSVLSKGATSVDVMFAMGWVQLQCLCK